jgi:hypothetical protein
VDEGVWFDRSRIDESINRVNFPDAEHESLSRPIF